MDVQPTLFDSLAMKDTQHRKYRNLLGSGKITVVLLVAKKFAGEFTVEDLAVECYKHDPCYFGMKRYPQYPDNHKIHSFLYGKRGLIHNGFIERVEEGVFCVKS